MLLLPTVVRLSLTGLLDLNLAKRFRKEGLLEDIYEKTMILDIGGKADGIMAVAPGITILRDTPAGVTKIHHERKRAHSAPSSPCSASDNIDPNPLPS